MLENNDFEPLRTRLFRRASGIVGAEATLRPDAPYRAGVELRLPADQYHWDGMQRGDDAGRPFVVFQVTLGGWGVYECAGTAYPLPPGVAFAAFIPSVHQYYLPPDTARWEFFWLLLRHPYIVARIGEQQRGGRIEAAVLKVTPDSPLLTRAITLLEGVFSDRFAEEMALFAFLVEYERHIHTARRNPHADAGERLLEETRRFVRERLTEPVNVATLAARNSMSRTRFSHHFQTVTGQSPAQFMMQVRLEEAARSLLLSDDPIAMVAIATGFADANHLCKAFRRHYQTSPGAFRRQIR